MPTNSADAHAAQWAAGGDDTVLHRSLSKPIAQTVVRLQCADNNAREVALGHGAHLDNGNPVIVVQHPVGVTLNAAQLAATAPPMAPFLSNPLMQTTTVIAGATHRLGAVQAVSVAPDAIARSEWQHATAPSRGLRAYRSRHLVASGGLDGISRVSSVTSTAKADELRAVPLSIQGSLRHGGGLSAVEVRPCGVLLTACATSSTLRVYELEAAHLAAARIASAGMPSTMVPTTAANEWNYVERARLQSRRAQQGVCGARWLDEATLVEAGFANDEADDGPPRRVLRTWRVGTPPHRAAVACADDFLPASAGDFSALAAGDGLVVATHNPPHARPGYADVWRAVASTEPEAPPALELLVRLQEHTEPLYACAVGGGLLATGGDDCTVRLWSAARLSSPPGEDAHNMPHKLGGCAGHASLQALQLPGKVWALALHAHLLVAGGALASEANGMDGHIRVRLFGVAELAAGRGPAVALRTLQAPSIEREWGVRSAATHSGTVVVAGGDDGVVHVWALAERGKAARGDGAEGEPTAEASSMSGSGAA